MFSPIILFFYLFSILLLLLTDVWSKFAWVIPMKKISSATVVNHLRELFSTPANIPRKIFTDRGVGKARQERHVCPGAHDHHYIVTVGQLLTNRYLIKVTVNQLLSRGYPKISTIRILVLDHFCSAGQPVSQPASQPLASG